MQTEKKEPKVSMEMLDLAMSQVMNEIRQHVLKNPNSRMIKLSIYRNRMKYFIGGKRCSVARVFWPEQEPL